MHLERPVTILRVPVAYTVLFLPASILATVATSLAIEASNGYHLHAGLVRWLVNLVPPFVVGFCAYAGIMLWLRRLWREDFTPSRHLRRTFPLYVLGSLLSFSLVSNWSDSEFWFFGQVVLWTGLVALAGIAADATVAFAPQPHSSRAA